MVSIYVIGNGSEVFFGRVSYRVAWDALTQGALRNTPWVSLHDGETLSGEFARGDAILRLRELANAVTV